MSTSGLHNEWGTCHKLYYSIWQEHNFDTLRSENWVLVWLVRLGLTAVSSISELLTPNILKDLKDPLVHFTTTTNQACLPFISFELLQCIVQKLGTLPNMELLSNMRIYISPYRCANEIWVKIQCWVGIWFFVTNTNCRWLRNSDSTSQFLGIWRNQNQTTMILGMCKKIRMKEPLVLIISKPQRTAGFHERTGKEVMVCGQLFDFFKEWEWWYVSQQGIWFLKARNRITLSDPSGRTGLVWKFLKSPVKFLKTIPYQCKASMNFGNKHPIPAGILKSRYPPITG